MQKLTSLPNVEARQYEFLHKEYCDLYPFNHGVRKQKKLGPSAVRAGRGNEGADVECDAIDCYPIDGEHEPLLSSSLCAAPLMSETLFVCFDCEADSAKFQTVEHYVLVGSKALKIDSNCTHIISTRRRIFAFKLTRWSRE